MAANFKGDVMWFYSDVIKTGDIDLNSTVRVSAIKPLPKSSSCICKKALTFRLATSLNMAGGMGRVWALVLFNKIAVKVIFKENDSNISV